MEPLDKYEVFITVKQGDLRISASLPMFDYGCSQISPTELVEHTLKSMLYRIKKEKLRKINNGK